MKRHHWLTLVIVALVVYLGYHYVTQHNAGALLSSNLGTK